MKEAFEGFLEVSAYATAIGYAVGWSNAYKYLTGKYPTQTQFAHALERGNRRYLKLLGIEKSKGVRHDE